MGASVRTRLLNLGQRETRAGLNLQQMSDRSALFRQRVCTASRFHQKDADAGSTICLFAGHSMSAGRENPSTA
jgi:hypothetical protein